MNQYAAQIDVRRANPGGPHRSRHQEPLLEPVGLAHPDSIILDNHKNWAPLIKCEPHKAMILSCINFCLNPLGTFIAACCDERGFSCNMFCIGFLQLIS